jgi:flagellar assembly protein FliH
MAREKEKETFRGFEVNSEPGALKQHQVSPLPIDKKRHLSDFDPKDLNDYDISKYARIRPNVGPVARTDEEGTELRQKTVAFHMSSLVRDAAGIEAEEARAISQEVVRRVEEIQDEARENARKEGFERGVRDGIEAGRNEWFTQAKDYIAQIDEMLKSWEKARSEIFAHNERFLVDMVFRIARMVLLKEIDTDREYVVRLGKQLIERTGLKENVTVTIGPKDEALLSEIKEKLELEIPDMKNFQIVVSPDLESGGCKVETDWNTVDASIDTQLEGLARTLSQESKG